MHSLVPDFRISRKAQLHDMGQKIEVMRYVRAFLRNQTHTLPDIGENEVFARLPYDMTASDVANLMFVSRAKVADDERIQDEHYTKVIGPALVRFCNRFPVVLAGVVRSRLSPIRRWVLDWYVDEMRAHNKPPALESIIDVRSPTLMHLVKRYAQICYALGREPMEWEDKRERIRRPNLVFDYVRTEDQKQRLDTFVKLRVMGRSDVKLQEYLPELVNDAAVILTYTRSQRNTAVAAARRAAKREGAANDIEPFL